MTIIAGALVIGLTTIATVVAFPLWTGQLSQADPSLELTAKLADLFVAITTSLQALGTAALGLLAFLFSEKVSSFWLKATASQRRVVLIGGIIILSSIITGIATQWGILSTVADGAVRANAPRIFVLQVIQGLELAVGFLFVAYVAVRALDHR